MAPVEAYRIANREDEIWFVFALRGGKVTEWRMFGDEREALEASGWRE